MAVDLQVQGPLGGLPGGVDLSAYRIVQEALTNALRHGDGSCAEVALRWQDDRLRIEVSNPVDARQRNGVGGGHGLVGIRERVALFDGRFSAGAVDGRFLTVAELPYDEVPA
jgi:signal transduction histidine kinase